MLILRSVPLTWANEKYISKQIHIVETENMTHYCVSNTTQKDVEREGHRFVRIKGSVYSPIRLLLEEGKQEEAENMFAVAKITGEIP